MIDGCLTATLRRMFRREPIPTPLIVLWSAARADRKEHTRRSL